ncbi:hydantoinase B/oxoprolinase family protein [Bdellovibrio svalbardensis]|uniref:Hydantoinase B/oxoprolinase family protein n=1 Tax=Bdellovibrio svalbardensis TaxID=2972972 RepID=A0ABT6DM29_9BACT|nr:hydantoinase B/oxoprolinase family protein [Bdellovibrio svalbardensis]MDG0817934.1 hydantoinase B/oxoprolinase family protein [Bdellovibrio svalbardensis]
MSYKVELFHSLLNDFLQGESALITIEGEVLAVRGKHPATYGTLSTAANIVGKYLKLQEGDIAVLNDPYSGGSTLDEMTFIMAVSEDLLWITRRPMTKSIKTGKSIEDEGLRIPPTPLLQNGKVNEVILSAMQAHPACPTDLGGATFADWIKAHFAEMILHAQKLHDTIEATGFEITGELIEEYVELSKNLAHQRISENASGETRVDIVLDSGELLRLNLEIHEGKIKMDFGGTSAAKTIHLTESAAFGTCFHTISRYYGFTEYANSGTFSALQVTKPAGCWLMAKYPASTLKGMTSGVAALQAAIELALTHIHTKREKAMSCYSPLTVQLQNGASHIVVNLQGGKGALASKDGDSAQVENLSIEMIERELPLRVIRADRRQSSGGKGKYSGGRGLIFKVEALEDIEATWLSDLTLHRPRITKNCSHGDPCEISLDSQGTNKVLPVLGTQKILKGDILTLCSGSGGGFGKAE